MSTTRCWRAADECPEELELPCDKKVHWDDPILDMPDQI